jgi:chromate transporter
MFLDNFLEITLIANAFQGIKIAVGFLILNAGISMMKKMRKKLLPRIIIAVSFLVMLLVNLYAIHFSSISLMLLAAAVSLSVFMIQKKLPQKGGEAE